MISRHMQPDRVDPVFEADELEEVLQAANSWAMLAGCSLADLSGDAALGARMLDHSKELNEQTSESIGTDDSGAASAPKTLMPPYSCERSRSSATTASKLGPAT
ncbi:MAG: hypothetical protein QOH86_678 [Sphingomonadales bacterium]|nr:hypothetical protein [Sphingomonadales bacterium]